MFDQMCIPHLRVMARNSVDFPDPFSPMKKVMGVSNSRCGVVRNISRLNGYTLVDGY
jgi:hypothetical protein